MKLPVNVAGNIVFYSETKDNYLANTGYMGEQIDLYLASQNIGALWSGIGKPHNLHRNGLDFVIMITIAKDSGLPGMIRHCPFWRQCENKNLPENLCI